MNIDEDESAPRSSSGAAKGKKKKRSKKHLHIGPNARAYRAGLAFCPVCDAESTLRLTSAELASEREAKIAADLAVRTARLARR